MCTLGKVSVGTKLHLTMQKKFDLRIFVHSKDDEFWLTDAYPLTDIFSARIPYNSDLTLSIAELSVTEKQTFLLNKKISPCKSYTGTHLNSYLQFINEIRSNVYDMELNLAFVYFSCPEIYFAKFW